jgi:hypothetical protein
MSLNDPASTNASRNSGNGDNMDPIDDSTSITNITDASSTNQPTDTQTTGNSLSASNGPQSTFASEPTANTAAALSSSTTNSFSASNGSARPVQPLVGPTGGGENLSSVRNFKVLYDPFLDTSKTKNSSLICRYQDDLLDEVRITVVDRPHCSNRLISLYEGSQLDL